jgi:hypothetical protein
MVGGWWCVVCGVWYVVCGGRKEKSAFTKAMSTTVHSCNQQLPQSYRDGYSFQCFDWHLPTMGKTFDPTVDPPNSIVQENKNKNKETNG